MKKHFYLFSFIIVLFTACAKDENPEGPVSNNQHLVTATQAGIAQKDFLKMALSAYPDYAKYANLPKTNVNLYNASYFTEYPKGKKVKASGVFMIPDDYNPNFPIVLYAHGSIYKNEAPSLHITNPLTYTVEVMLCAVLSSSFNCAVLMPDYIGYGASEAIPHPYIHAESLGQTSIDLIKTFKEYAATSGASILFNKQIFITGYSEGGFAAVALQKKIQETSNIDLQVVKTIAGAGVYDNIAFAKEFLSQNSNLDPHFVSSYLWAMGMYKTDFAYSKSYEDIFSTEDNAILKATGYDMAYYAAENLAIQTNPALLFKQTFKDNVLNGTDTEFLKILNDNSLVDFSPRDSLIFVCGTADTYVYPVNTYNAYNTMVGKGCKVKLYEHPGGDHTTTLPVYLDILLGRLQTN